MKRVTLLVVLLGVFAWLVWRAWPEGKSAEEQAREQSVACFSDAWDFCQGRWCERPRNASYSPTALADYEQCLAQCKANFSRQCLAYGRLTR
jgi:hypothetical protein